MQISMPATAVSSRVFDRIPDNAARPGVPTRPALIRRLEFLVVLVAALHFGLYPAVAHGAVGQEADAQVAVGQEADAHGAGAQEAGAQRAGAQDAFTESPAEQSISEILDEDDPRLIQIEAQIDAGEYRYAERWLQERISNIEQGANRYDGRLVRPLTLLGDAKSGQGEFAAALGAYERAVHVSRVNDGLISPEQVEIVYREANVHKATGNYAAANDREEYAFYVLTSAYDRYDEAILPGVFHLAEWYAQSSNLFSSRALYEYALNILHANGKSLDPAAIPALRGIANSYRLERFPPFYVATQAEENSGSSGRSAGLTVSVNNFPAGERALQSIIAIERSRADADPVRQADAMLELADWYLLFDKTTRAMPLYKHVWEVLSEVENYDVEGKFAEPELLYFPAPSAPRQPPESMRGERTLGFVELGYLITQTGYVRDLDTVASQPKGLMDFRVRKSMRLARYRPAIINGVPVDTADQSYRYEFPYFPRSTAKVEDETS